MCQKGSKKKTSTYLQAQARSTNLEDLDVPVDTLDYMVVLIQLQAKRLHCPILEGRISSMEDICVRYLQLGEVCLEASEVFSNRFKIVLLRGCQSGYPPPLQPLLHEGARLGKQVAHHGPVLDVIGGVFDGLDQGLKDTPRLEARPDEGDDRRSWFSHG